jgi:hypothetical protein
VEYVQPVPIAIAAQMQQIALYAQMDYTYIWEYAIAAALLLRLFQIISPIRAVFVVHLVQAATVTAVTASHVRPVI